MRKGNNFKYFVSEGTKSYSKNGLMSVASTVIVVASLLVFGIYLLFSMNINHIASQLESKCEIQAWIDESVPFESTKMQDIENKIKTVENVKSAEFFSNKKALEEYREQLGKDAGYLDGLEEDNPLRDSYKISLDDLSKAGETADEIAKISGIASVTDNRSSMNKIVNATNVIRHISFWFMIFLSAIAVFIISNTIKITLFARRREINIMKYLGATNSFISWPFVIEGIVIGIVGALISLLAVTVMYWYFLSMDFTLFGTISFCTVGNVFVPMFLWFTGIGILLGAFGSAISIRRYLRV